MRDTTIGCTRHSLVDFLWLTFSGSFSLVDFGWLFLVDFGWLFLVVFLWLYFCGCISLVVFHWLYFAGCISLVVFRWLYFAGCTCLFGSAALLGLLLQNCFLIHFLNEIAALYDCCSVNPLLNPCLIAPTILIYLPLYYYKNSSSSISKLVPKENTTSSSPAALKYNQSF